MEYSLIIGIIWFSLSLVIFAIVFLAFISNRDIYPYHFESREEFNARRIKVYSDAYRMLWLSVVLVPSICLIVCIMFGK